MNCHTHVFLSDEELDNRNGREQFVELDSLDTEKALLLSDDDDPLWVCNWIVHKLLLNNLRITVRCTQKSVNVTFHDCIEHVINISKTHAKSQSTRLHKTMYISDINIKPGVH